MTAKKKREPEPETPEPMVAAAGPVQHMLEPGDRITVLVNLGEQPREHVIEALEDGSLRVYQAPEPAAPVSTPNPISGT